MPSTHTNLHYHLVFSTRDRAPLLIRSVRTRIHAYLGGTVRALGGVPLEIGGPADHVHLLVGLKATHRLADVLRTIKRDSCRWIHVDLRLKTFAWQEGYGAFTVCAEELRAVGVYIRGQEEHHRARTYQEEYREFLVGNGIPFEERFLW